MANSNEQCPKSAGKLVIFENNTKTEIDPSLYHIINKNHKSIDEDAIDKALSADTIYSDSLANVLDAAGSVLLLSESRFNPVFNEIYDLIRFSGKEYEVVFADTRGGSLGAKNAYGEVFENSPKLDRQDYDDYAFFGITKQKTPVLINNAYMRHDTVVVISSVNHSPVFGYTGGAATVLPGIAAAKTTARHAMSAASNSPKTVSEHLLRYTGNDDSVDGVMISRAAKTYFAISTISNSVNEIASIKCGDLFMVQTVSATEFGKMYSTEKPAENAFIIDSGSNSCLQDTALLLENLTSATEAPAKIYLNFENAEAGDEDFIYAMEQPLAKLEDEIMTDAKSSYLDAIAFKKAMLTHELFVFNDNFENYGLTKTDANSIKNQDSKVGLINAPVLFN